MRTLKQVIREHVLFVLTLNDGCVSKAARDLGICRSSLQRMLRRWRVTASKAG